MDEVKRDREALFIASDALARCGVCPGNIERCVDFTLESCARCVLNWLWNRAELEMDLKAAKR